MKESKIKNNKQEKKSARVKRTCTSFGGIRDSSHSPSLKRKKYLANDPLNELKFFHILKADRICIWWFYGYIYDKEDTFHRITCWSKRPLANYFLFLYSSSFSALSPLHYVISLKKIVLFLLEIIFCLYILVIKKKIESPWLQDIE